MYDVYNDHHHLPGTTSPNPNHPRCVPAPTQSFAAKRRTLELRAEQEGRDVAKYEQPITFHGCDPDVIPNIAQMGFVSALHQQLDSQRNLSI